MGIEPRPLRAPKLGIHGLAHALHEWNDQCFWLTFRSCALDLVSTRNQSATVSEGTNIAESCCIAKDRNLRDTADDDSEYTLNAGTSHFFWHSIASLYGMLSVINKSSGRPMNKRLRSLLVHFQLIILFIPNPFFLSFSRHCHLLERNTQQQRARLSSHQLWRRCSDKRFDHCFKNPRCAS
jgi:hypothetical protein